MLLKIQLHTLIWLSYWLENSISYVCKYMTYTFTTQIHTSFAVVLSNLFWAVFCMSLIPQSIKKNRLVDRVDLSWLPQLTNSWSICFMRVLHVFLIKKCNISSTYIIYCDVCKHEETDISSNPSKVLLRNHQLLSELFANVNSKDRPIMTN